MDLKQMRKKSGLTQEELAIMCGVNLRSLQDYEQGHKPIQSAKGETLYKLSMALGYSIEDILQGSSLGIDTLSIDREITKNRIIAYQKKLQNRKTIRYHFPIIAADEYVDMSVIYPTKQVLVKQVLNQLRSDERILSLRLFGSSITMACHKNSDLDFAVELNDISTETRNDVSEKIQIACDWGADIIWLDHIRPEERIYTDIMKGLILI